MIIGILPAVKHDFYPQLEGTLPLQARDIIWTLKSFKEIPLADPRLQKFARLLVDYSTRIQPGDKVAIVSGMAAEPLLRELYIQVLERGAYPHLLIDIPDQLELLFAHANDETLQVVPQFHKMAFEAFDVLIKLPAETNTRALTQLDPARQTVYRKAMAPLLQAQMRRGAAGALRWMSSLYPASGYAMEAEMGNAAYQDFFFGACHCDENTADPVAYWKEVEREQDRIAGLLTGRDRVELRGPNAELTLSIKDRTFLNACGQTNMPDGEVFTGPVEESVNGWVRYTYPAVMGGRVVEGVELTFQDGKVIKASAEKNQDFLFQMLDTDPGARYLGEFAIGLNYEINRFTRSILLDEKIGGSFHTALGASYPETGGRNQSMIHWDLICDMRQDSEIRLDGEAVYRNGRFIV